MDHPDGCAVAVVYFNVHLGMMNGSIFMKGEMRGLGSMHLTDSLHMNSYSNTSPNFVFFCSARCGSSYAVARRVGVIQGCTCGSDFFAIAIQASATRLNREVSGQIMRLIIDGVDSCGSMEADSGRRHRLPR